MKGQMRNGKTLTKVGLTNSFLNNLTASAKGWGKPINPTLFGPLRSWKYPNPLRSNKVKKATAKSAQTKATILDKSSTNIIKKNTKYIP